MLEWLSENLMVFVGLIGLIWFLVYGYYLILANVFSGEKGWKYHNKASSNTMMLIYIVLFIIVYFFDQ